MEMTAAEEIFADVRELTDPVERAAWLDQACGQDADLRAQVEALLRDADAAREFFGGTAVGASPVPGSPLAEGLGSVIGRYKLLEQIGEGGMGVVYMAEQREPVARRVALKIIKLGLDTRGVIARFEAERQALALMDHPHIAKVLDAGNTPGGRPFFVMELVQGVPITEFCASQNFTVAEILRLFLPVCHAVQHAHQKGVIHRDLKPSNILVAQSHGAPHPLVIDFGVAKATQQRLTEKTLFTNFGTMIGTPAYMSPEQAEMGREDVDTRSDLYSLGVLLYELLTGTTPFPEQRLRSAGLGEMQRILREEEPERPSTRLITQQKQTTKPSAIGSRYSRASKVRGIDPDLDWIVMKCLEKDRRRRYETVNGFAVDLQRHLGNEPVAARPPSAVYRLQKLVRRHRVALAAGAGIALALVLGLAAAIWQAVRATRAERAFREQAETATSVKDFLVQQVLRRTESWGQKRYDPNDRVLLDRIARALEGRFTDQPLVEAELRVALGFGFGDFDDWPSALQQAERFLALRSKHLGATHSDALFAASAVGYCLYELGRHREADQLLDDTIAKARAASHLRSPGAAEVLFVRGWRLTFEGQPEAGLPHLTEALDIFRQTLGENHARTSAGRFMQAVVTQDLGDTNKAEALFKEGIQQYSRSLGTNDPMVAVFLKGYGLLLIRMGRANEAITNLEAAIAIQQRALGPDSHPTLESETYLADALALAGNTNGAIARNVTLHQRWAQYLPQDYARRKVRDLGHFFVRYGRYDQARVAFDNLRRALIDVPPQRPDEWEALVRATAAVAGWSAAADLCRTEFDAFPASYASWLQKAWIFRYTGRDAEFRHVVSRVLTLSSTSTTTNEQHVPIEIVGLAPNEWTPAEKAVIEAHIQALEAGLSARTPELRLRAHRAIAQYRLRNGELQQSLDSLKRAADALPGLDAFTLYLKAICLNRMNQLPEARASLGQADRLTEAQTPASPEAENFLHPSQLYQGILLRREAHAEIGAP